MCNLNSRELIKRGWVGDSGFKNGVCAKCQYESKDKKKNK